MFRAGIPMDSMEAIWWGKYCLLGTNKHPPLSGFPAYAFYLLFAENVKSVYFLSQACILVGFIYIYKLALLLLDKDKAVLSVMLLEGVIFYGFCSPEYNVNVLSLALWPANAYYFYRSITENRLSLWMITGFVSALNFLNKYVSGLQLAGIACYLLLTKDGREFLKTYKPYAALALFSFLVIPHFYWLYQHDFMVMEYFASRSGGDKLVNISPIMQFANHFLHPIQFLTSLFFYALGTLIVFFYFNRHPKIAAVSSKDRDFLFFLGIFPLLLVLICSLISGNYVKSMWGFPLLYLLGIILFKFFQMAMTETIFFKMQRAVYLVLFINAIAYGVVIVLTNSPKYNLNGKVFAEEYTAVWHNHTSRPLKYVVGDVWLPSIMVLQSSDKPIPVIWGKVHRNPWVDAADFKQSGAMVFAESLKEYNYFIEEYADKVSAPAAVTLEFKNVLGKSRQKKFYYGFYEGK